MVTFAPEYTPYAENLGPDQYDFYGGLKWGRSDNPVPEFLRANDWPIIRAVIRKLHGRYALNVYVGAPDNTFAHEALACAAHGAGCADDPVQGFPFFATEEEAVAAAQAIDAACAPFDLVGAPKPADAPNGAAPERARSYADRVRQERRRPW